MLSLPLITPRDSHELWFGVPKLCRAPSQHDQHRGDASQPTQRRSGHNNGNARAATTVSSLSALQLEERALRARKQNIASFGYSWIKPAGCPKTMLGMKEEEAEREEALAAAAAEMASAAAAEDTARVSEFGSPHSMDGQDESMMERDLDDDIPDADNEGLAEEGEEALDEGDVTDEEGYMERDLDNDIPDALDNDQEGSENDFNDQPDLDDEIPSAGDDMGDDMEYDLDEEIPEATEEEWQHTDTEAEFDDDGEGDYNGSARNSLHDPSGGDFRTSTSSGRRLPMRREIETEAQRRFLQLWSGEVDTFDSSRIAADDDDDDNHRESLTDSFSR